MAKTEDIGLDRRGLKSSNPFEDEERELASLKWPEDKNFNNIKFTSRSSMTLLEKNSKIQKFKPFLIILVMLITCFHSQSRLLSCSKQQETTLK